MSSAFQNDVVVHFPELIQTTWATSSFPHSISFESLAMAFMVATMVGLWLTSPGGLAWAVAKAKSGLTRIPGPSGAPLTGSLSLFTQSTPHRALASLAQKLEAKPLMAFSVGLTRFVVSSHPETAKEILGSSSFGDRPVKESAYELLFHRAMGFASYGEYWRGLRRVSSTHLFSPKKISDFESFRVKTALEMVEQIKNSVAKNGVVEVKKVLHFGSLNNVMMTVFGRSYEFDGGASGGAELEGMVKEGYELLGIFNWSDHFPLLGWLDLQGVRKRSRVLVNKVNTFVGKIIEEHRVVRKLGRGDKVGDFVDVLLDLEENRSGSDQTTKLSDSDMIAVLWEMIFRGTDTVAILLEWILARLILHPEIQTKLRTEIDAMVGKTRPVSDTDIPNLPYLQAVVKETLRAHPPGPLLSWARLAIRDTQIDSHLVPAGTTAMVNMWSITHDPAIWPEPEMFKPERFLEDGIFKDLNVMGSDLRLAPFGSGRRVCPGKSLGLASVHLWLGILVQSFEWVVSDDHGVDLTEVLKLSMEMNKPLVCKAIPRATCF